MVTVSSRVTGSRVGVVGGDETVGSQAAANIAHSRSIPVRNGLPGNGFHELKKVFKASLLGD